MSDTIQFYYNPMSRSRIVHWMLEEVGAPYEIKLLDFAKNEHKSPEYLKLNPMGKVPAIVHRDVVVTECAAICAYLADAFPQAKLAPALDDPRRGTYLRWMFFAAGPLASATADKGFPRGTPARPSSIGYGTYDDTISTLETAIKPGPWVLGDQFSAADVYLGSQVSWGMMFKWIDPRPSFTRYSELCISRPAAKRAEELANAIIAKMKG
jgi:glutathione S-transferase